MTDASSDEVGLNPLCVTTMSTYRDNTCFSAFETKLRSWEHHNFVLKSELLHVGRRSLACDT